VKVIETLLWTIGGTLMLVFLGGLTLAEYNRSSDVAEFRAQLAQASPPATQKSSSIAAQTASFDVNMEDLDTALWSEGRKAHFEESLEQEAGPVMALLEIPSLDLEVPVYDGASELHMNLGIARIEGTAQLGTDGNLGMAGHRDGFFRVLKDIKYGDELLLTTMDGVLTYKVDELQIVDPSAIEVLNDRGRASITLVTCYPFYFVGHAPERFIVHATLQET
jgi:sortase A